MTDRSDPSEINDQARKFIWGKLGRILRSENMRSRAAKAKAAKPRKKRK